MTDLIQSLKQHDEAFLQVVQSLWKIEPLPDGLFDSANMIAQHLLNKELIERDLFNAPGVHTRALSRLMRGNGKAEAKSFFHAFGELRIMGEARFLREKPWLDALSAAEWLWYRGIIYTGIFDDGSGMKTFVYIPDDLFALFPKETSGDSDEPESAIESDLDRSLLVRPAAPREVKNIRQGTDGILDLACLVLAAIRTGNNIESLYPIYGEGKTIFLVRLLKLAGILDNDNIPVTEVAQLFLQKDRMTALLQLAQVWAESATIDELFEIPELTVDKLFRHDPHATRRLILTLLSNVQGSGWSSFQGFSAAIRQEWPEFLRDQSENAAWLLRNSLHSAFRDWENVEAVYMRYLFCGPCFWLGLIDIAAATKTSEDEEQDISAFRINEYGRKIFAAIIRREPLSELNPGSVEKQPPTVTIDGRIMVGKAVSRILRYHIARFCEWEKIQPDRWLFRVTPISLRKAKGASLKISAFLNMLKRACGKAMPESLTDAIEQWDQSDTQATMFEATVLTVTNPDWIVTLLNSRDSSKWIERQLNANTLLIKPKGEDAVRRVLIEIGVLTDKQI